jgi:hypothetical protein
VQIVLLLQCVQSRREFVAAPYVCDQPVRPPRAPLLPKLALRPKPARILLIRKPDHAVAVQPNDAFASGNVVRDAKLRATLHGISVRLH